MHVRIHIHIHIQHYASARLVAVCGRCISGNMTVPARSSIYMYVCVYVCMYIYIYI